MMWEWHGGWWWLWGAAMMTFWILLIAAAVYGLTRLNGRPSGALPREILAERYARGEISTDEYRERVDQLN